MGQREYKWDDGRAEEYSERDSLRVSLRMSPVGRRSVGGVHLPLPPNHQSLILTWTAVSSQSLWAVWFVLGFTPLRPAVCVRTLALFRLASCGACFVFRGRRLVTRGPGGLCSAFWRGCRGLRRSVLGLLSSVLWVARLASHFSCSSFRRSGGQSSGKFRWANSPTSSTALAS